MLIIWEKEDFKDERTFASKVHQPKDAKDLRFSHYFYSRTEDRITYKTCTRCSQEADRFIWYPIEAFGHRIKDGKILPQPQCTRCR